MTRIISILLVLLSVFTGLSGQQSEVAPNSSDEASLKSLKRLTLPAGYASLPLPAKKDNTRCIYFSGIYNQEDVWNCNQASSIWTLFTYEINYLRNLNSSLTQNQYSPMAVYNLLRPKFSDPYPGVSYFDSWNLIQSNGIPANSDFSAYSHNSQTWMTGYDKYYRGMKNRVDEVFAIDVGNPEGLLTLKYWINDHLEGSQTGGLANFQLGSGDMVIPQIPLDMGLEEEGQYIVTRYGPYVGHAMTFAGWNDSVRYDINGDGRYTNNIDINGDGSVNMKDWEIGAMLVVNSWGTWWGNAGKVWVMYRLLAESTKNGGIWNNVAMVVKPKKTYDPLLTVKTKIRYNQRNRIKIQVGVASDLSAHDPERIMDFPCFNFQGDTLPMQGFTGVNSDIIEIGLDITPLMNYFPANGQAKIFLEVIQKSSKASGSGNVLSYSVMDYTNGSKEFVNTDGSIPILRNAITRLSVPVNILVNKPLIVTETLPDAEVGAEYQYQLEAAGTIGPYHYANPATGYFEIPDQSTIDFSGGTSVFTVPDITARVMDLPFSFPFYGTSYNQITILTDGGIVMGQGLVVYPYVIDNRLRFYQNKGLFPFLGNLFYPDDFNKVTFAASLDEVVVRWRATLDPEGNQPVEFAAKMLPDGKIRFYYGNVSISPDIPWISGISAGNNMDYYLMNHNNSGLRTNSTFNLELVDWPAWLSLGSAGNLHGTPGEPGIYSLPLTITDWSGISSKKELMLKVIGGSAVTIGEFSNGFRVFPNPAIDVFWFQGYTDHPGNLIMNLYDLTGNLIFTKEFTVPLGQILLPVMEIKSLTPGVYIYQLKGIIEGTGRIVRQ